MREILFRAKAINRDPNREYRTNYKNGDWVYGLIERIYDERFPNIPSTMIDQYGVSNIDVDYKTISEYTGLTDKNGKKIFEGDIIKHYNCCNIEKYSVDTGRVFFYPQTMRYLRTSTLFPDDCPEIYENNKYEVIGNIFENPELLEENK